MNISYILQHVKGLEESLLRILENGDLRLHEQSIPYMDYTQTQNAAAATYSATAEATSYGADVAANVTAADNGNGNHDDNDDDDDDANNETNGYVINTWAMHIFPMVYLI